MTTITEYLAEQKRLAEAATEGPWEADGCEVSQHWSRPEPWLPIATNEVACMAYCYGGSARGIEREADAEFIAAARESVPRMIAALDAVSEAHRPVEIEPSGTICHECSFQLPNGSYFGKVTEYPCPTIRAIEAALGVESDA